MKRAIKSQERLRKNAPESTQQTAVNNGLLYQGLEIPSTELVAFVSHGLNHQISKRASSNGQTLPAPITILKSVTVQKTEGLSYLAFGSFPPVEARA